jgi:putative Mg2+ transporter-C (MgtC) family protein
VLVGLGAALFTSAGVDLSGSDPTRIAAQVVTGIGFLGAGAILRDGGSVRGLTTAASLFVTGPS